MTAWPDGVDLTDLDRFAGGFPHELFATHRREAPVWWHEPTEHTPGKVGFWSVATHAEVLEVLHDHVTYSSERGGTLIEDLDAAGSVLTMMDDPRHGRIRRLVSGGLTPRRIARLEDDIRARATALIERIEPDEPFDVVADLAAELPMQVVCSLVGVPEADRGWLHAALDPTFDIREGDATDLAGRTATSHRSLQEFAAALVAQKRDVPADDLLSIVASASVPEEDPPRLSDAEVFSFLFLLFSAGSDTTRNALASGLLALAERPDQLDRLRARPAELLPSAVEEVLRWTTPSSAKRRTATRRATLGGRTIEEGDKVVVWEASANRDERVFERPMELDVARSPNPHVAFGHGVHYCLGANLARLELRVALEELLARFRSFEVVEPAEWWRSNRHTGVRRLVLRARG